LPVWRLHRAIGLGGDQLVTAVAGERFEHEHGEAGARDVFESVTELVERLDEVFEEGA
jgi:hypothetical protein